MMLNFKQQAIKCLLLLNKGSPHIPKIIYRKFLN